MAERETRRERFDFGEEEIDSQEKHLPFLGGAASVDGSLGIQLNPPYSSAPFFVFSSTSEDGTRKLVANLGGRVDPVTRSGHHTVRWRGYKAAGLGERLLEAQVAPSREEILLAFVNWLNADDAENRLQLALDLEEEGVDKHLQIETSEWASLLDSPDFSAGIVSRGGIGRTQNKNGTVSMDFILSSRNKSLLAALEQYFGGIARYDYRAGRRTRLKGKEVFSEKGLNVWQIAGKDAADMLVYVADYLGFDLPEGWQGELPVLRESQRNLRDEVRNAVKINLQDFQDKKIERVLTIPQISRQFNIDESIVLRVIHNLPEELLALRTEAARKQRSSLSPSDQDQLLTLIREEIKMHKRGETTSVTKLGEWATLFDVDDYVIGYLVRNNLSPDLRNYRNQITRNRP